MSKAAPDVNVNVVRTLPSVAATHAYVPDVSRLDNIM
jgi:hypothetical protein